MGPYPSIETLYTHVCEGDTFGAPAAEYPPICMQEANEVVANAHLDQALGLTDVGVDATEPPLVVPTEAQLLSGMVRVAISPPNVEAATFVVPATIKEAAEASISEQCPVVPSLSPDEQETM
jgi:hypothetical protein